MTININTVQDFIPKDWRWKLSQNKRLLSIREEIDSKKYGIGSKKIGQSDTKYYKMKKI